MHCLTDDNEIDSVVDPKAMSQPFGGVQRTLNQSGFPRGFDLRPLIAFSGFVVWFSLQGVGGIETGTRARMLLRQAR